MAALRAHVEGPPVVGSCAVCDQPLVSDDASLASVAVVVSSSGGALSISGTLDGPTGAMTVEEAERWLRHHFGESWWQRELSGGLVPLTLAGMLLVPVVGLWLLTLFFFLSFMEALC